MELQIAAALAAASEKISKIETELTLENIDDFERVEFMNINLCSGLKMEVDFNKRKRIFPTCRIILIE